MSYFQCSRKRKVLLNHSLGVSVILAVGMQPTELCAKCGNDDTFMLTWELVSVEPAGAPFPDQVEDVESWPPELRVYTTGWDHELDIRDVDNVYLFQAHEESAP